MTDLHIGMGQLVERPQSQKSHHFVHIIMDYYRKRKFQPKTSKSIYYTYLVNYHTYRRSSSVIYNQYLLYNNDIPVLRTEIPRYINTSIL